VQSETGFELIKSPDMHETPAPTKEQLELIQHLDPHQFRASIIKGNPAGSARES
jgi:glutaconate CoA-transferase subunit B